MLKVESNVTMPITADRKRKYPWMQLNLVCGNPPRGDSFLVECNSLEAERTWNSLTSCAHNITYRTGRKFAMRRVLDGIRVWRIR